MSEPRWEEQLNFNWVTPLLAVGGRFPIEAAEHLAVRLGIRYVVDLRVEERDDEHVLREHGITLLQPVVPYLGVRHGRARVGSVTPRSSSPSTWRRRSGGTP